MASSKFTMTRDQIITAALRKLGVLESGASPSDAQISDGSEALNIVVKGLQNIGVRLWTVEWETQTFTSGSSSFSPDPLLTIQKAFVRRNGTDYPVGIVDINTYFEEADKSDTGMCQYIAVDPDHADPVVYIYPVPDNSTDVLHYQRVRKLSNYDVATDKGDFPERWFQALVWNLAAELSPEYGIPVEIQDRLVSRGTAYLEQALRGERNQAPGSDDFVRSAY